MRSAKLLIETGSGWPLSRLADEARRPVRLLREKMILPDRAFSTL